MRGILRGPGPFLTGRIDLDEKKDDGSFTKPMSHMYRRSSRQKRRCNSSLAVYRTTTYVDYYSVVSFPSLNADYNTHQ